MALIGVGAVGSLLGGFATWSYLAQTAIEQIDEPSLAQALFAYDEGRMEQALDIIEKMAHEPRPELFGGALFVLGAVKAHEADNVSSEDRQKSLHAVAARYLQKARALGVPSNREKAAKFLHARSLILGEQGKQGALLLNEIAAEGESPGSELDHLLVRAYLQGADPQLAMALDHADRYLANDSLTAAQRTEMQVVRAKTLVRLGRSDEARVAIAEIGPHESAARLLAGRIDVEAAERLPADAAEREALLASAKQALESAGAENPAGSPIAREALYWLGKAHVAEGNEALARERFSRLNQLHAEAQEGFAAQLEEAQLETSLKRWDRALEAYRVLLESVGDLDQYQNDLVPLAALRTRLMEAYQGFVQNGLFGEAETYVEQLAPLFGQLDRLQMRGELHQRWGDALAVDAEKRGLWRSSDVQRAARRQYRAAGTSFEALARLRFATRMFPDDLWMAAQNYYQGQSYTHAARIIEEYLRHEVRRRGAPALLRLGQCRLAVNRPQQAIEAFEECLETYPDDTTSFRVRLEFARAANQLARFEQAKELLQANLGGDKLTPESADWRDSKFEMGRILYESGAYEEAIQHLEEAVTRYPEADAAVMALYTIARANHASAEKPARLMVTAKTENERQKSRAEMTEFLNSALAAYEQVQRTITLGGQSDASPLHRGLLRNCYMMQGAAFYELKRYSEAQQAFANVSNLYQNDPFVLESYVQMANCWRQLNQPVKARGTIRLARSALENMPANADFLAASNFSRQQWQFVLDTMYKW